MYSSTETLAKIQQQFIDQIFRPDQSANTSNGPDPEGLVIYRNNLLYTASRALLITYPVLAKLLGDDVIRQLAGRLLRSEPPATGNWADWGKSLQDVIASSSLAETWPFLQDTARLEWAMHQSGRCAAQPIDMQALATMRGENLLQASIQLSPCLHTLESDYPLDHIWHAHQTRNETAVLDTTALASAIAQHQGSCRLLIYQRHQLSQMVRLSEPEFRWISDVQQHTAITDLIERHPQLDFISWLTKAIELNWISGLVSHELYNGLNHPPTHSNSQQ